MLLAATAAALPIGKYTAAAQSNPKLTPDEACTLARDAWVFGLPLSYIEKQIDTVTHVTKPQGPFAPINQFKRSFRSKERSVKSTIRSSGWGTWIRTKINGVRVPACLVDPERIFFKTAIIKFLVQQMLTGAFQNDLVSIGVRLNAVAAPSPSDHRQAQVFARRYDAPGAVM